MSGEETISAAHHRLYALLDRSPAEALEEGRNLVQDDVGWRQLRAAIMCDAGLMLRETAAVREASEAFTRLLEAHPDDAGLTYNLGNALSSRALLDAPLDSTWHLRTAEVRRRARSRFHGAAMLLRLEDPEVGTQAMTNLANELDRGYRWIEAYESYLQALAILPVNGMASGNAAIALFEAARRGVVGHQPHMLWMARRLARHAQAHEHVVVRLGGPQAVESFARLPSEVEEGEGLEASVKMTAYERFVAKHRLYLSPILEGPGHDRTRWDDAHIRGVTDPVSAAPGVPPIFAMFNVVKADYLVARELLYRSLNDTSHETGLYMDTLDYAVYGQGPARLVLAQRAALDILDKVAVALNEHFELGCSPNKVNFRNIWRSRQETPTWRPALRRAVDGGNVALIALAEIAVDLAAAPDSADPSEIGILNAEQAARNTGTHRFAVLHDIAPGTYRPSAVIEHQEIERFRALALQTIRLARAALLHFLEAIAYEEGARGHGQGLRYPIPVRPHHEIRGDG